jgi:hypothetical protein
LPEGNPTPSFPEIGDFDLACLKISLAANYGFHSRDLSEIERLIQDHQVELLEAWHEHLG